VSDDQEISADDILEETPSISPMAMSLALPSDSPEKAEGDDDLARILFAHRKQKLRKLVSVAVGASMVIILAATIRTGVEAATTPSRTAAAAAPPPVAVAALVAPVSEPEHKPLPPAVGTITAPRGQAFTVDGIARAAGASVIVPCGSHVVRVGREAPQTLDVLCGKTIVAGRAKK
jgi:hypothetical protein